MSTELTGSTFKEKWSFSCKNSSKSIFSFFYAGNEIFESEGSELGVIKETSGLVKAIRPHFSEKTAACSVDSETLLPFGSEPRIKRKCEQSANHFRVTTDISIPAKIAVDSISVDSLKIKGDWTQIDIYSRKSINCPEISKETLSSDHISSKGLILGNIPMAIVLRNADGLEIEIGAGYDLWRWDNSARFKATASFTLKKQKNFILFERKPFLWKEDHEISKYNFRFTWYFAWGFAESEKSSTKRKSEMLEINNNKLIPVNNSCSSLANVALPSEKLQCFASRQTQNLLKDFIRSTLSNNLKDREKNLTLRSIHPQICSNPSHMERAKEEGFLHWDYFYIMAFHEWANRFLSDSGKKFHIAVTPDSILSALPSARGLEIL